MRIFVSGLIAFVTTAVLLAWLRHLAERIDLIDVPSERKTHVGGVPLIGGLAMFCGFVLGALTLDMPLGAYRAFFAAAAILVIVGVLDDLHELSSRARFAAQIVAAALMVWWGGVSLHDLGALRADGSAFELGRWEVALTIFATVGVINALNMCDGLDGLAGGLALIAIVALAWLAHEADFAPERSLLTLLAVVLVAFLLFNAPMPGRPQALVFMGDAGSMFLGFAITWFVVSMSQAPKVSMAPVTALWLLLVPLYDTVWLLAKRPASGRWPTTAGYEHLHHVLQMAGLGATRSVLLIWALAALAAAVGVGADRLVVAERTMFHAFLALFALYCVVMGVAWWGRRLLVWPIDRRFMARERRADVDRREAERRGPGERRAVDDRREGRAGRDPSAGGGG